MLKPNVTKDAQLQPYEILDYNTLSETGINSFGMKLPKAYDITKYFKRNKRNRNKGKWVKKGNILDFSDDFDWQITYSFPDTIRDNASNGVPYGSPSMSFRRLYLLLCEKYNGGNYFIDEYFDTVYPYTVKDTVDAYLDSVKETMLGVAANYLADAVATKRGTFDKRYKQNIQARKNLRDYHLFARQWEEKEGDYLAQIIKDDIINCMATGQLQASCIRHINTERTINKRISAGFEAFPTFMASAQLIESIQLFVKIRGNGQWKSEQGILV